MAWWGNIAGTALEYFRLGLSGVRLKNNAGALAVRNAGDSADANLSAADISATGSLTVAGNTTIGSGAEDTIVFNADHATYNVLPFQEIADVAIGDVSWGAYLKQTNIEATADGTLSFPVYDYVAILDGDYGASLFQGLRAQARWANTLGGTLGSLWANNAFCIHNSPGTVTNAIAYYAYNRVADTGNIGTATSFLAAAPSITGSGTITTSRGFHCNDVGAAGFNTGISFNAADMTACSALSVSFQSYMTAGTNKWGVLSRGGAANAFVGDVRIGSMVAPTVALDVTGSMKLSGAAEFTGQISALGNYVAANSNASVELGAAAANTPYIDFHSGATLVDYDSRIIASGGTGTAGEGKLDVYTGELAINDAKLTEIKTATFNSQPALATTTGAVTVDWTAAQNYKQNEPTGAITYTFTAPPGPCHLQLLIDSDGTSSAYTHVWPGTVIWMGSTWAQAANKKAIINFWYDGTNYYAMGVNQV